MINKYNWEGKHTDVLTMERKIYTAKSRIEEIGNTPITLAYSGGKDAIVVAHMLSKIRKVELAVFETCWAIERTVEEGKKYADDFGIKVTCEDSLSFEWLRKHPQVMFTSDVQDRALVDTVRQQRTIKRLTPTGSVSVFGRRKEENCVRKYLYETKAGWQLHPIFDWTFEDIRSYFRMFNLEIPWIYSTIFGKLEGQASFPSIQANHVGGMDKAWEIVSSLDSRFTKEKVMGV